MAWLVSTVFLVNNSVRSCAMNTGSVKKEQWVEMFREIGLDDSKMRQWHRVFEQRNPEGHQEFLEWLNIPGAEIAEIRAL
jgi:hypothetical protein